MIKVPSSHLSLNCFLDTRGPAPHFGNRWPTPTKNYYLKVFYYCLIFSECWTFYCCFRTQFLLRLDHGWNTVSVLGKVLEREKNKRLTTGRKRFLSEQKLSIVSQSNTTEIWDRRTYQDLKRTRPTLMLVMLVFPNEGGSLKTCSSLFNLRHITDFPFLLFPFVACLF